MAAGITPPGPTTHDTSTTASSSRNGMLDRLAVFRIITAVRALKTASTISRATPP